MARSAESGGKNGTAATQKKRAGKPAGGPRGGITAPVTPSADLAEIVGKTTLPRSEVISKVWDYIKKHNLQDVTISARLKRTVSLPRSLAKRR